MNQDTDLPQTEPAHPRPAGTAAFRHHAGELDLFAGRHTMSIARTTAIVVLAALLAAVLNAQALAVWSVDLPFWLGPVRTAVVDGTRAWADATTALGLDQPYQLVRETFRWFQYWTPAGGQ